MIAAADVRPVIVDLSAIRCDGCGEWTTDWDWYALTPHRYDQACPKCRDSAKDADPRADKGDWEFHHGRGQ